MNEVPYDLFRKYLNGESTLSENRQLMRWLLENEENERIFADTMSVISAAEVIGDEHFESNRDAFLERLSRSIEKQDAKTASRKHKVKAYSLACSIAAAVAVFAVILFAPGKLHTDDASLLGTVYSNTDEEPAMTCLPDGTNVWIMSGSSLRYVEETKDGTRDIYLTGEAFFDVAKDTLHPFVVKTPGLSVVAVGTRFNVLVEDKKGTEVMLEEGSVRLCNPQGVHLMRLCPDQTATFDLNSNDIFVGHRYVQAEIRLKYNVIALNDATVQEIANSIARAYKVEIKVGKNADDTRHYNFCCLKSRGVDEALVILAHLSGVDCEIVKK